MEQKILELQTQIQQLAQEVQRLKNQQCGFCEEPVEGHSCLDCQEETDDRVESIISVLEKKGVLTTDEVDAEEDEELDESEQSEAESLVKESL